MVEVTDGGAGPRPAGRAQADDVPEPVDGPGPDDEVVDEAGRGRARRTVPSGVARATLALALVAALVASGAVVWTLVERSWVVAGREIAGDQQDQQSERDELMSIGRQFMLRSGTYGPDGLDGEGRLADYRAMVLELITPSFANTFDTDAGIAEQLVASSDVAREAEVFSTGVSSMSQDEASVLVAGSITDSFPELTQPQEPFPFRVEVQLVRLEGEWFVDDFAGVRSPQTEDPGIDPDLDVPEPEAPEPDVPEGQGGGGQGGGGQGGGGQGGGGQGGGGQGGGGQGGGR